MVFQLASPEVHFPQPNVKCYLGQVSETGEIIWHPSGAEFCLLPATGEPEMGYSKFAGWFISKGKSHSKYG